MKYRPYTPLTVAKSAMSAEKIVVRTTCCNDDPAASSTARKLSITRTVCASTDALVSSAPVAGRARFAPNKRPARWRRSPARIRPDRRGSVLRLHNLSSAVCHARDDRIVALSRK